MNVRGVCAPAFEPVRAAFEAGFAELGELGGGVCVTHDGEVVVDLVGGVADQTSGRAWEPDTLVMVWSATKGIVATCAHLLAAQGELELDAPLAHWWPAFAAAGKRDVTVAMALAHQAGVPGIAEPFDPDEVFDAEAMAERVAAQAPFWEPGTRHGYHSFTFGWIVGELVRRVSGRSIGAFMAEHVAEPLGLDAWIGLPETEHARVARVRSEPLAPAPGTPIGDALARGEPVQLALRNSWGRFAEAGVCGLRAARTAEVPAANGFATARGLALLYMALATDGRIGDVTLPPHVRARMAAVASASARDATTLIPSRFSCGFHKTPLSPIPGILSLPEEAFGHAGQGGSFGVADPVRRLSVAYVTNAHFRPGEEARPQRLLDAAYRSLGVAPSA